MKKIISLFLAMVMLFSVGVSYSRAETILTADDLFRNKSQNLSEAKENYLSLLRGNYNDWQLKQKFIELFGDEYSNEYIRENYRTIFDLNNGEEINEAVLDIITDYEPVFGNGNADGINERSAFTKVNQQDDANFITEEHPVFVPAPEPELIVYGQATTPSSLVTDEGENGLTPEVESYGSINTMANSSSNSFTSISFVSATTSSTTTSVTFDIWYKSGDDPNNYLKMYDTESWTTLLGSGAGTATSKRYTATGLKPGYFYTFRTGKYDWDTKSWITAEIKVRAPGAKAHTLSVVSKSYNSITMKVQFPAEGIWGNRFKYYDNAKSIWVSVYPDELYGNSGTYTIKGLSPGTNYSMYTDYYNFLTSTWSADIEKDVTTDIPPANLISYSRSNINFKLDKVFTDTIGSALTNAFLDDTN